MTSAIHRFTGIDTCPEHGPYEFTARQIGMTVVGRVCPKCLTQSQALAKAQNDRIEAEVQDRGWRKRLQAAGIPEKFMSATFDSYHPTNQQAEKMLHVVRRYVNDFDSILKMPQAPGVVLVGVPGTGKTHIGCAMVELLLRQGHSATYLACPQFLLHARESHFSRTEERTSALIDRYTRSEFLVIDEFGTHTTQDVDYQILFSMIDGRYMRNLPTLLATNLTAKQLEDTVDDRFLERVRGLHGPLLSFDWPTHRRPNADVRA